MSLFGALFSGVSALNANSQVMGIIADNIINLNTVGFKATRGSFSTLVAESTTRTSSSPGGVQATPEQLVDRQGILQISKSSLDIGISGKGFFVVNTNKNLIGGTVQFTRAGSFRPDSEGYLRNASDLYLQGWKADDNGTIANASKTLSNLESVRIEDIGATTPTTSAELNMNLQASQTVSPFEAGYNATVTPVNMASGNVPPDFERTLEIIDSQGVARSLTMGFLKRAVPNEWHVEFYVRPAADVIVGAPFVDGQIAVGVVAFNADGSLDVPNTTLPITVTINWTPGSTAVDPSVIVFDYGTDTFTDGFTQFEAPSELTSSVLDGRAFARLSTVSITEDGGVVGLFTNGLIKQLYQVPLAIFANPNGLANKTGNAFEAAADSGAVTLKEAGTSAGRIAPSSLEASTVDLGEEFTTMITVQRAFTAAARLITTADDMLEELVRIKR